MRSELTVALAACLVLAGCAYGPVGSSGEQTTTTAPRATTTGTTDALTGTLGSKWLLVDAVSNDTVGADSYVRFVNLTPGERRDFRNALEEGGTEEYFLAWDDTSPDYVLYDGTVYAVRIAVR